MYLCICLNTFDSKNVLRGYKTFLCCNNNTKSPNEHTKGNQKFPFRHKIPLIERLEIGHLILYTFSQNKVKIISIIWTLNYLTDRLN